MFPIAAHPISFTCFTSSQFFFTHFLHSSVMGCTSRHSPVQGVMKVHPFCVSTQIHYYRSLIHTYQRESGARESLPAGSPSDPYSGAAASVKSSYWIQQECYRQWFVMTLTLWEGIYNTNWGRDLSVSKAIVCNSEEVWRVRSQQKCIKNLSLAGKSGIDMPD